MRARRGAAAALVLACLAACGEASTALEAEQGASGRLEGLWRLDADGEPAGTSIELGGAELSLLRPCVTLFGTWSARDGLFLGDIIAAPASAVARRNGPG